jgi:hypothetical protein
MSAPRLKPAGCGRPTWSGWAATACAPARCGHPVRTGHRHRHRGDGRRGRHLRVVGPTRSNGGSSAFGTNLLTVSPGQSFGDEPVHLPDTAIGMITAIPGVESVSAGRPDRGPIYRNDHIPERQTGGIIVYAARTDLPSVIRSRMAVAPGSPRRPGVTPPSCSARPPRAASRSSRPAPTRWSARRPMVHGGRHPRARTT